MAGGCTRWLAESGHCKMETPDADTGLAGEAGEQERRARAFLLQCTSRQEAEQDSNEDALLLRWDSTERRHTELHFPVYVPKQIFIKKPAKAEVDTGHTGKPPAETPAWIASAPGR